MRKSFVCLMYGQMNKHTSKKKKKKTVVNKTEKTNEIKQLDRIK